jgi:cytochrome c biogenesis protein CcdA
MKSSGMSGFIQSSLLILIAGTSMGATKRLIESKGVRKANLILQKAAGVIIILVGIYFLL